jgi:hypothetical protein
MSEAPRLLFVPASGAEGAGEYYRCLTFAQAARARWPDAAIQFVVNREAGYARGSPFETIPTDGSPTFNTAAVKRAIDAHRPDVVICDSAGRVAQLAHARRQGAATVYVSSRMKTRWKGFRLRRMHRLDQHWLAWPRFLEGDLTFWERTKLALLRGPEVVFLDPVQPGADALRAGAFLKSLGLVAGRYLFFTAGGGGYTRTGLPAPDIFGHAALEVHQETGRTVVWVKGPNYRGEGLLAETIAAGQATGRIVQLDVVRPDQMQDLLAGAGIAVINGGSLLLQALAARVITVAAPVAGDQPQRIEACVRRGLIVGSALDTAALTRATLDLLDDPARCRTLDAELRALALGNGAEQAVDALARLLARRRPKP